jgi:micrococcal nuclease
MFTYNAELVNVVDGDTVDLKIDLGFDIFINTRVRLLGIDTPEIRTRNLVEKTRGMEAKKFVENAFAENDNKCVLQTLKDKKGKYGRYLATIIVGDKSLNQMLIDNNHKK